MQLKIRRSQRDSGVIATKVIFCIDARVELTPYERENLRRYKLHSQVIYNSAASARHLARAEAQQDGSTVGALKSLGSVALAAMNLNITVKSLEDGKHIECKDLEELLAAEDALITACKNLKTYLDIAATFNGGEVLIAFEENGPTLVAQSVTPEPMTVLPAPPPLPAPPAPGSEPTEPAEIPADPETVVEEPERVPILGLGLSGQAEDRIVMAAIAIVCIFILAMLLRTCAA